MHIIPSPDDFRQVILSAIKKTQTDIRPNDKLDMKQILSYLFSKGMNKINTENELKRMRDDGLVRSLDGSTSKYEITDLGVSALHRPPRKPLAIPENTSELAPIESKELELSSHKGRVSLLAGRSDGVWVRALENVPVPSELVTSQYYEALIKVKMANSHDEIDKKAILYVLSKTKNGESELSSRLFSIVITNKMRFIERVLSIEFISIIQIYRTVSIKSVLEMCQAQH